MTRLLILILAVGAAIPTGVHAQTSQPSAAQCDALAKYRDAGLYAEWSSTAEKSSTYGKAMQAIDEAYADVKSTKSALHMADLAGSLAHAAGTLSNLTMNLVSGAPVKQLEKGIYQWLAHGKFAVEMVYAPDAERLVGVPMYMTDMIASASGVGRGAIAVRDLALDLKGMTNDLAESASIRRQLDQQMMNLRRDAEQLENKIAMVDSSLARIGGIKGEIDKLCGSRGCALPGAANASRKGAVACLVNDQASCLGCKDGWRHRCDATASGLAWRPVDECLTNELKNAKAGQSPQQTAASLLSAQADTFASMPSAEDRANERKRSKAELISLTNAIQREATEAQQRNQALRATYNSHGGASLVCTEAEIAYDYGDGCHHGRRGVPGKSGIVSTPTSPQVPPKLNCCGTPVGDPECQACR